MAVERWPLALRADLVQVFDPGKESSREGPFRTLRSHRWTTSGKTVVIRRGKHAAGRITLFSALNVDAALAARSGHETLALSFARAAERIEASRPFSELVRLLSGLPAKQVNDVALGVVESDWPELDEAVRKVAVLTHEVRTRGRLAKAKSAFVAGRVSQTASGFVVVTTEVSSLAVPRELARAAHRDRIGDCLAIHTDKVDERGVVIRAVPGVDLQEQVKAAPRFSPFRRGAPVDSIDEADAKMLRGRPAPLIIRVPVVIEE